MTAVTIKMQKIRDSSGVEGGRESAETEQKGVG